MVLACWVCLTDVGFDCSFAHETGKGQGGPTMSLAGECYMQYVCVILYHGGPTCHPACASGDGLPATRVNCDLSLTSHRYVRLVASSTKVG
jgi:hypothetical protein